ncbi:MAG TPA: ribose 5-phosphate isomerase B [Caldilineae bacterium]|jgi:ribose 5-phosphate isomerase B|nr:ribose 5-phosphate isomerase B [Caldilineae bacterium]
MRVAVAADHSGVDLKREIIAFLRMEGFEVKDLGTDSYEAVDYPDYARKVVQELQSGQCDLGVLVGGTGIGMSIAANRYPGIRAAVCTDAYMARISREHNDANVLCLGAHVVGVGRALDIVHAWIKAQFDGGRHARRVAKIEPRPEYQAD